MLNHKTCENEGHSEGTSTREPDHEEGLKECNPCYDLFLPLLWMLWICSLWEPDTREPLDRVWIL